MKKQMAMLQVLDMSGVTELPKTKYWNGKRTCRASKYSGRGISK